MSVMLNGRVLHIFIDDEISSADWHGISAKATKYGISRFAGKFDDVELDINSPGGDFIEGMAIRNELLKLGENHRVGVSITGLAASTCSVLALSGTEKPKMRVGSYLMIHRPTSYGDGDFEWFQSMATTLMNIGEDIAKIYVDSSTLTLDEAKEAMRTETWYTSESAQKLNFAEEVPLSGGEDVILNNVNAKKFHDHKIMARYRNVPPSLKIDNQIQTESVTNGGKKVSDFLDLIKNEDDEKEARAHYKALFASGGGDDSNSVQNNVKPEEEKPNPNGDSLVLAKAVAKSDSYPESIKALAIDALASQSESAYSHLSVSVATFDALKESNISNVAQQTTAATGETAPQGTGSDSFAQTGVVSNFGDISKIGGGSN